MRVPIFSLTIFTYSKRRYSKKFIPHCFFRTFSGKLTNLATYNDQKLPRNHGIERRVC